MEFVLFGGYFFDETLRREFYRRKKIARKSLRDRNNPFLMVEKEFMKLFRMPQQLVMNIIREVELFMQSSNQGVPIYLKVSVVPIN